MVDQPPGIGGVVKERGLAVLGELKIAAEATAVLIGVIWIVQGVNVLDEIGRAHV